MIPQIKEQNFPTTPSQVDAFEQLAGVILPPLYRQFLEATNGGVPIASRFPISGMPKNLHGSVHVFLGIGAPFESEDLVKTLSSLAGKIPDAVIPIACTAGDDLVCLDLRGTKEKVGFWDHRHFWSSGEWRERDFYPIANSFAEFLGGLTVEPSS